MKTYTKLDEDDVLFIENESFNELTIEKSWFLTVYIGREIEAIKERITVENVNIQKCKIGAGVINSAKLKNVLIDGLAIRRDMRVCNSLFQNCVLKGRIGRIMLIESAGLFIDFDSDLNREVTKENESAYEKMDWALDISEADFTEFDCRSMPAEKIIINNENQMKVDYEKLCEIAPHSHPTTDFKIQIDSFLKYYLLRYNILVTTSKSLKSYEDDMRFFNCLQDNGCQLAI